MHEYELHRNPLSQANISNTSILETGIPKVKQMEEKKKENTQELPSDFKICEPRLCKSREEDTGFYLLGLDRKELTSFPRM